jgi:hypothetical protein
MNFPVILKVGSFGTIVWELWSQRASFRQSCFVSFDKDSQPKALLLLKVS